MPATDDHRVPLSRHERFPHLFPALRNGTKHLFPARTALRGGGRSRDGRLTLPGRSVFFPLSLTSNAVLAGPGGGDGLVALNRSDGSVLWRNNFSGQVAATAAFGSLAWGMAQPGDGSVSAVAFGTLAGHQVYTSVSFTNDGTQGLPPAVNAGRVYVNLGSELLCLALPAAARADLPAALAPALHPAAATPATGGGLRTTATPVKAVR